MCLAADRVENEFKMALAGHDPSSNRKMSAEEIMSGQRKGGGARTQQSQQKFDPGTGKFKSKASAPDKIYQRLNLKTGTLIGEQ